MKRTTPWRQIGRPKPDKVNREGFPSFKGTPEQELVNVLMTGTTANHFYCSGVEFASEAAAVIGKYDDHEFLAKATVYARENGYMRELPIAAAVAMSAKDRELFQTIVHRVCRTPTDWRKFIDIARSGVFRSGVGRALKKEIIEAIRNMRAYHAIKYPAAVRDMIRIARPRESVNPAVIRYIMKNDHSGDEQLETLYRLKRAENPSKAAEIIREGRLPYEVVTGSVRRMTPEVWEALLHVAPYLNLVRNLNNFSRNGVFEKEDNLEYAVSRITDRDAIRKAMVFPFTLYIAHRMLETFPWTSTLKRALEEAIELSVDNVPELKGRICIASDVSWSMSSAMTGDRSVLQCIDVVGVFTGMLIKKCRDVPMLLPFNDDIRYDIAERVAAAETVVEMAQQFIANGGTSLSAPVEELLRSRTELDYLIAFTDNEEWAGRDFMSTWQEYKRTVAPECKAYLVTLKPYRDFPVPPNYPDVHFIFGWSDAVIRYITTDPRQQMRDIKEVRL